MFKLACQPIFASNKKWTTIKQNKNKNKVKATPVKAFEVKSA